MPRVIALVSGGIDSPVAARMLAKKNDVIMLHFCIYPYYCAGSFRTALKIFKKLHESGIKKLVLFPWAETLTAIRKADTRYQCVLCRKAMFRAAELVCRKEHASAIATGEALGQKASQTLDNLCATSSGIKKPILRPLISYDKNEIIRLSKSFGFMPERHVGCCKLVPDKPVTHADAKTAVDMYKAAGLEKIIKRNLQKIVEVTDFGKLGFTLLKKLY